MPFDDAKAATPDFDVMIMQPPDDEMSSAFAGQSFTWGAGSSEEVVAGSASRTASDTDVGVNGVAALVGKAARSAATFFRSLRWAGEAQPRQVRKAPLPCQQRGVVSKTVRTKSWLV